MQTSVGGCVRVDPWADIWFSSAVAAITTLYRAQNPYKYNLTDIVERCYDSNG
jgi:hypothetical protein